ncbi:hypothetical protein BDV34DRAFT_74612 [Aspergillus parasiticus]|uniref:Uncharacterized protein n=1 Tax=Aspergillus parasiticus TaxID=5067 RepID=A0A5N6DQN8_ASPPA|nr:hypothetical protein BDV34DRAFT_74612 [Aspergillus parasiticus]
MQKNKPGNKTKGSSVPIQDPLVIVLHTHLQTHVSLVRLGQFVGESVQVTTVRRLQSDTLRFSLVTIPSSLSAAYRHSLVWNSPRKPHGGCPSYLTRK